MRILVVGGSDTAEELLRFLDLRRNEVIVVDSSEERCKEFSSKYDVYVVNKDAADIDLYTTEVDVFNVDAVIALTDDDKVNLFVLSVAKAYNVPIRVAKVSSPRVAELLLRLNLGIPISPSSLAALMIKNYVDSIRGVKLLGEFGDYKLYLISLAETDSAVNKSIKDLELPQDTKILLIFDGSRLYPPNEEVVLGNGYQLIILSNASEEEITRRIKG